MKWKEFLNDPQVKSFFRGNSIESEGEYLYKKMLHDMLACLNGYKNYAEIISLIGDTPQDIQRWFSKWMPSIDDWITNLTNIAHSYYEKEVAIQSHLNWPSLIIQLGNIPKGIALQCHEAEQLEIPIGDPLESLIRGTIKSVTTLNLICAYIEKQKYKALLMMNRSSLD